MTSVSPARFLAGCIGAYLAVIDATFAGNWYWRPPGSVETGGDGRTYQSAWTSDDEIRWNLIQPGDYLFVCGVHDAGYRDRKLVVSTPRVTVTGACTGDPGSIVSVGARIVNWRPSALSGVFQSEYGGIPPAAINQSGKRLTRLDQPPDAAAPCDTFHFSETSVFYYKPCGPPVDVLPHGDPPVILVNADDVVITQLSVSNAGRLIEVRDSKRVVINDVSLRVAEDIAIHLTGNTSLGAIRNSTISESGNGVYASTTDGERHDGWIIENNVIRDIYGDLDSHGIGWQTGSDNVIRRNRIEGANTGITFYRWAGSNHRMNRNVIAENEIADMRKSRADNNSTGLGRGIELTGDNCPQVPDLMTGNAIVNNRITRTDAESIYVKVPRHSNPAETAVIVRGNVSDAPIRHSSIELRGRASDPPSFHLGENDVPYVVGTTLTGHCGR